MKYSEFETVKNIEEQLSGMKILMNINKGLRFIGLGSKKISDLEEKIKQLENQLKELKEIPQLFNEYFSDRGWITYDSLNHEFMKDTIKIYRKKGLDEAEKKILEYYQPEKLKFEFTRLKALPALLKRHKFIEYAMTDYTEQRYYSVVPLLIMIIDGTVNEIVGKGFHSDKSEMDVWDSITNIDNGILKIKEIFRKGRNKTREEEISFPYRNGILHGMDLGYDNYKVAAKCWHFLFVVRDWGLSKQSEKARKEKFIEESTVPTFKELDHKIIETNRVKEALKSWKKREISDEYISSLAFTEPTDKNLPETIALQFLKYWKEKNYGYMAKMYWSQFFYNGKPNIKEIRKKFDKLPLEYFKINNITDEAAGISVIEIIGDLDNQRKEFLIRMIYEGSDGYARSRNLLDGNWKIVFAQENKTKGSGLHI